MTMNMSSSSNGRSPNGHSSQSEFYVHQEGAHPLGPVPTETLARNVVAGNLSQDALVGLAGGATWEPASRVPEIREAVRRIASEPPPASQVPTPFVAQPSTKPAPVAPTVVSRAPSGGAVAPTAPRVPVTNVPAAPTPATSLSAAAAAPTPAPAPVAPAPAPAVAPTPAPAVVPAVAAPKPAAAAAAPAKAAEPVKLDPKYKFLPLVIFGACGAIGSVMTVVTLILR
jgi:hypothetical protein